MNSAPPTPWIELRGGSKSCSLRLFCFPSAGGSAPIFRTWGPSAPPQAEVCPIQPPGRLSRMREKPHTSMAALVQALLDGIRHDLNRPFAFFGHSLGSLVAFEVARELRRRGAPGPKHLIVAGRGAPQVRNELPQLHGLSDRAFVDQMRQRYGGIPDEIVRDPELLAMVVGPLRADVAIHETWRYTVEAPLDCPITAVGGASDAHAPEAAVRAWREQTTSDFVAQMLPGGHFFFHDDEKPLLRIVWSRLGV